MNLISLQPEAKASPINQAAGLVPGSREAAKRKKAKQKSAAEKKLEDRFIMLLLLMIMFWE